MRARTITAAIIVVLLALVMFSACKKSESERAKTAPEAHQKAMLSKYLEDSKKVAAAKVNGEDITMFSLLREMNEIGAQYLAQGQKKTPQLDEKVRNDALNGLIFRLLALQEAKQLGLKIAPEVVNSEIKKLKTSKGSDSAFQEYLAKSGLNEGLLRKTIEEDALFEMIAAQEVDGKITVSDQELKKRYAKERAGLKDAAHKQMTFEQAKGMLEQKARAEAAEKRMREWGTELEKTAKIEIFEQKKGSGVK